MPPCRVDRSRRSRDNRFVACSCRCPVVVGRAGRTFPAPVGRRPRSSDPGCDPGRRWPTMASATNLNNAIDLNNASLSALPIDAPKYDRGSVTVGIAHIGAGHFHRAHQAVYINLLLQQSLAHEWGICGVGVMPADWTMRDVLNGQDGLYTL